MRLSSHAGVGPRHMSTHAGGGGWPGGVGGLPPGPLGAASSTLFGKGEYSQNILAPETLLSGGTYTASSEYSGSYTASNAFNGLCGTTADYWQSANGVGGIANIKAVYGSMKRLTRYSLQIGSNLGAAGAPTGWIVEASADGGASWTQVDARSAQSLTADCSVFSFTVATPMLCNAIRLTTTGSQGGSYVGISKLCLYEQAIIQPQASYVTDMLPTATGATTGSFVFTASSYFDSASMPWMAFNDQGGNIAGSTYKCWQCASGGGGSNPSWLSVDTGAVNSCGGYTIKASDDYPARAPYDFILYGSNTGAFSGEQVALDTRSGVTYTSGEKKSYTLASTANYRYYRLYMTRSNDASWTTVAEVELLIPPIENAIVITGAATVTPDALTFACVVKGPSIVLNGVGASLKPSTNCKGLYLHLLATLCCSTGQRATSTASVKAALSRAASPRWMCSPTP